MKVSALFAMGRSGITRWQAYVLDELNSPDPQLQYEAVRAAGELFLDEAVPTLLHLARSAVDQDLRHEAIWALGHSSSLEAWQLLEDIANDASEDEETRLIAEDALDEYYMFQEMSEADDELFEDDDVFDEEEEDSGNGRYRG
jgi:HEAT repeat protein